MLESSHVVASALRGGHFLLDGYSKLITLEEVVYEVPTTFSNNPGRVRLFVGKIDDHEVLGASQSYHVATSGDKKPSFLDSPLDHFWAETSDGIKVGFEFIDLQGNHFQNLSIRELQKGKHYIHAEVRLHSFFHLLNGPRIVARNMTRNHPMKARVVFSESLNKPLGAGHRDAQYLCYAFTNERVGPEFFGFGPGKFEQAVKHYSVCRVDDDTAEVTMTSLIAPRSRQLVNLWGMCPVYAFLKLVDSLTWGRFQVYATRKTQIEFFMMRHHVRVHQHMLAGWLQQQKQP